MARPTEAEAGRTAFERWLEPFLDALGNKKRRMWAPLYVRGLILPGDRKSMDRIAERVAPDDTEQINHFVAASRWELDPVEQVLWSTADGMVGGDDAVLVIDDTALLKKGRQSVGVAHQYCGQIGAKANCQALVSLTLARNEVPVPLSLHLYMPESWTSDRERMRAAAVPEDVVFKTKWQIALEQVARVQQAGVRFGVVLADGGYGVCAEFRQGLSSMGLTWSVGILKTQMMYSTSVQLGEPSRGRPGRPGKHPIPSEKPISAEQAIASLGPKGMRMIAWRLGTKGMMHCEFAAMRVRVADGLEVSKGLHLPGDEVWLVCERRSPDDLRYYLSNQPRRASLKTLATAIKGRWVCEQGHQQMKEELGLDHFEGRSWHGLHHHALLTMIAFAYLQHLRLRRKKNS
jgi:SRSO17 transposase